MLSDHLVWPYVLCSYLDSVLSLWPNRLRIKPTEARVSVYRQSRSSVSVFDHCYHMCVFAELLWSPHHIYKCDRIGEDYLITITWEEKSLMRSLKYLVFLLHRNEIFAFKSSQYELNYFSSTSKQVFFLIYLEGLWANNQGITLLCPLSYERAINPVYVCCQKSYDVCNRFKRWCVEASVCLCCFRVFVDLSF